jgi:DNA-binding MurR/RpiR family transcriptional regulator
MSDSMPPEAVVALLRQRAADATRGLPPAALKLIRFMERNPALAATGSAADLARRVGLSDATVIRTVQALGFAGMSSLRRALAAALEGSSPAARMAQTLRDSGANSGRAIDLVLDAHVDALNELRSRVARDRLIAAIALLVDAKRIVVFGMGPTGMLARYAVMLLTRAGRPARSLDLAGIALADQLLDLRAGDALLLLAYGRPYREVTATIEEARRPQLPIVLMTDGPASSLARMADVTVPAQRGRARRVALHGATLVALEALVLGLAATDQPRALASLEQLNALREAVSGQRLSIEGEDAVVS